MARALYEPGLGYYATSRERPTRGGDFLTAPELHPIFGRAVGRQVEEMWRRLGEPVEFTVREYGAGRGTLGAALPPKLRYEPAEFDAAAPGGAIVGCVLANEFLDALPVHRVVMAGGRLRELYVDWSGQRFAEVAGEPSSDRLGEWFDGRGIDLADGQRAEVNLAMLDWLVGLPAQLERGHVLIFDYGLPAAEMYGSARLKGTLRAFRSHHVSSDALAGAGRQDLTAHVDLDALEAGAAQAGLGVLGHTTQAEFLVGCGLEALLEEERAEAGEDWEARLTLRSAVRRLLDPRALGGYTVVVLGRGVQPEPPLAGLSYRLPRRR